MPLTSQTVNVVITKKLSPGTGTTAINEFKINYFMNRSGGIVSTALVFFCIFVQKGISRKISIRSPDRALDATSCV